MRERAAWVLFLLLVPAFASGCSEQARLGDSRPRLSAYAECSFRYPNGSAISCVNAAAEGLVRDDVPENWACVFRFAEIRFYRPLESQPQPLPLPPPPPLPGDGLGFYYDLASIAKPPLLGTLVVQTGGERQGFSFMSDHRRGFIELAGVHPDDELLYGVSIWRQFMFTNGTALEGATFDAVWAAHPSDAWSYWEILRVQNATQSFYFDVMQPGGHVQDRRWRGPDFDLTLGSALYIDSVAGGPVEISQEQSC